jgi:nucleoid-associated protein YgaU
MRKDVKTGLFIGIGLVFVGWILFALYSDTLQERRQKQLAHELTVSTHVEPPTTPRPVIQNPVQPKPTTAEPVAPAVKPAPVSEKIHVVEAGQTLSSISTLYYGKGDQWPKILEANKDTLQSPAQLRPGMRLKIPAK